MSASNALRIRPADALEALWDEEAIPVESQPAFFTRVERVREVKPPKPTGAPPRRSRAQAVRDMAERIRGVLARRGAVSLRALCVETAAHHKSPVLHGGIKLLVAEGSHRWTEQATRFGQKQYTLEVVR